MRESIHLKWNEEEQMKVGGADTDKEDGKVSRRGSVVRRGCGP